MKSNLRRPAWKGELHFGCVFFVIQTNTSNGSSFILRDRRQKLADDLGLASERRVIIQCRATGDGPHENIFFLLDSLTNCYIHSKVSWVRLGRMRTGITINFRVHGFTAVYISIFAPKANPSLPDLYSIRMIGSRLFIYFR